jgi:four helix bundle protein
MRRAAVSVPSNIAEGYSRLSPKDFSRFLVIARGSVFELQTQLEICERLKYLQSEYIAKAYQLREEVSRMLYALQKTL